MSATGKRRLIKLAEFLETAELPGKFDMSEWHRKTDCGTSACALGWATTIPSFRRAGLTLGPSEVGTISIPEYDGHADLCAASAFFDIGWFDADNLFRPRDMNDLTGKRGRKIVARRIRKLVAYSQEQP